MAWPESLTEDQQVELLAFTTNLRAWAALLWKINNLGAAIGAQWNAANGISAIVAGLQSGDVVPNASGLAGSMDLSPADITSLESWAQTLANPSNADQGTGSYASVGIQQLCAKAAGINALLN